MVGGIRYEHAHRVIASLVGFLSLLLTVWIGKREKRTWVRWLAIGSFATVVLQGILGGLTVLFLLPAPVSITHACLAPLFFSSVVALALVTSPNWPPAADPNVSQEEVDWLARFSLLTASLIFFQLLLGAIVRHTGSAVSFHIVGAFVVFIHVSILASRALSHFGEAKGIVRTSLWLAILATTEFCLGIGTFVVQRLGSSELGPAQIFFPTLHQTLGALVLAMSVALSLWSRAARAVELRS